MCNPIETICDDIASHVRDRERDLIERLRNALDDVFDVDVPVYWAKRNAADAITAADAWLGEPVEITVQPEYGEVKIDPAVEAKITAVRRVLWTLPAFASVGADSIARIVDAAVEQTRKELESDVN